MTHQDRRDRFARYLRLTEWARNRYSYRNAKGEKVWLAYHGLTPSRFTRIEDMAGAKVMGWRERFPGLPLSACPAA